MNESSAENRLPCAPRGCADSSLLWARLAPGRSTSPAQAPAARVERQVRPSHGDQHDAKVLQLRLDARRPADARQVGARNGGFLLMHWAHCLGSRRAHQTVAQCIQRGQSCVPRCPTSDLIAEACAASSQRTFWRLAPVSTMCTPAKLEAG
jgi:hypothetical protein